MRTGPIQLHPRSQIPERGSSAIVYAFIVTLEIVITIVAASYYGAQVSAFITLVASKF